MERKLIFNMEGDDSLNNRQIIKGNTTNIIVINEVKYQWAYNLYKLMSITNFWIPQEIPMQDDRKQYESLLNDYERRAYELILSFLIALDSFQVEWLPELKRYITSPELSLSLTAQSNQEALHSFSYQYILESVVDPVKADEIYNYWREDDILKERNKVITEIYNSFVTNPNEENFLKGVFANYVLESIYFYSGFAIFYTLGRHGKMINTVQQIKYINRDEATHITLFKNIIETLKLEQPELFTPELENWVYEFFKYSVDAEIKWGQYVTQNKIEGITNKLIERYIKYLANLRLTQIGFKPLYHVDTNPLDWIDTFKRINDSKTDFFQKKPLAYSKGELKW